MIKNSEISFYVDCLIVESILSSDIIKNGQGSLIHSMIDKVKNYFSSHIDQNDKAGSVLDIIAPAVVGKLLSSLFGPAGWLMGLAMQVFHINVSGIFHSIFNSIKGLIGSGKPTTSSAIDSAVHEAVSSNSETMSNEDLKESSEKLKNLKSEFRDAQFTKIAMADFVKNGGIFDMLLGRRAKVSSSLGKVLSWFFKIALASAGLLVAGDVINKFIGRPNAIDKTFQKGKPEETQAPNIIVPAPKQTKFKLNPSYKNESKNVGDSYWQENKEANQQSIENIIIQYSKDVYDLANVKESDIRETPGFQTLVNNFMSNNSSNLNTNIVFIPRMFHNKKQIVDLFIDDVANIKI